MGDSEDANNNDMMQRLHLKQMEQLSIPQFNQMRARHHFQQDPCFKASNGFSYTLTFSITLTTFFFSLDSLPPLSPSPFRDSSSTSISDPPAAADVSMEDRDVSSHSLLPPSSPFARACRVGESLPLPPPRKAHRRSNSDIPFGFSTVLQSSPPLIPLRGREVAKPAKLVKRKRIGKRLDALNSLGTDDKNNSGENRDDWIVELVELKTNGGVWSMDSFIGKLNFNDESPKLPPSPGLISPGSNNAIDGNSSAFSLEFGDGEFSGPELKKIMANEETC
ncbi:putative transcription factor [Sesbania bispinosa]|nr:putative transcription factor [Sesbania bispinosa]